MKHQYKKNKNVFIIFMSNSNNLNVIFVSVTFALYPLLTTVTFNTFHNICPLY